MKFPEVFIGERKPWKGILLYGVIILLYRLLELEKLILQRHV